MSTPCGTFDPLLVQAFARLVTHGHGGTFRLTRSAMEDLGRVRVTRVEDIKTGDIIFTVDEVSQ